jgi:seryl-tRNA(Sec) selenium transferase
VSLYRSLGVRRVVNACGIYTDLGGSRLGPEAWAAAQEANATWAAMGELLERSGERIAALVGTEAARVVPGASAGIALSVAACIARGDGPAMEALPATDAGVYQQPGHAYKYARVARLSGARLVERLAGAAAVLHPAHLDGVGRPLREIAPEARAAGAGVVVDAAYLSDPVSELARWSADADLACFSAKYFHGPNGGGFVAGRREAVEWLAALDFTGYESGPWLTFGRAWKLDRATVAATVAALEAWLALDHAARREGYAALASALAQRLGELPRARCALRQFTLDERLVDGPVNAVALEGAGDAEAVAAALAAGDPSVRCIVLDGALVFCTETLAGGEPAEITAALQAVW